MEVYDGGGGKAVPDAHGMVGLEAVVGEVGGCADGVEEEEGRRCKGAGAIRVGRLRERPGAGGGEVLRLDEGELEMRGCG